MGYDLDPELAAALAANPAFTQAPPPPPPGVSEWEFARQLSSQFALAPMVEYYKKRLPDPSLYTVIDKRISVEDPSGEIIVRYVRPSGEGETFPVLVWYHGGGYVIGDLNMDDNHLRTIAVDLKLAIVNVDYRLAPEFPFPTPIEDCYTALKWVVENTAELKIDLKKGFLVGGDSGGANASAALAIRARDDPFFAGRQLTGQYLREPAIAYPGAHPEKYKAEIRSFDEYTDTPLMNKGLVEHFFRAYGATPSDVRVSPIRASSHAGLPPAFIQVQEFDPVRDDGILYEKVLREAGVPAKLIQYKGCLHGFHYTFPHIGAAVKIDHDARDGLRWLLKQGE